MCEFWRVGVLVKKEMKRYFLVEYYGNDRITTVDTKKEVEELEKLLRSRIDHYFN